VWFGEEVREMTIFPEQYDFTITLLLLEDRGRYVQLEPDPDKDTYDWFSKQPSQIACCFIARSSSGYAERHRRQC
jgi:hypothetical protein